MTDLNAGIVSIDADWTELDDFLQREANKLIDDGLWKAIEFWQKNYLRFHFTMYAYSRYPGVFKQRKPRKKRFSYIKNSGAPVDYYGVSRRPLYQTGTTMIMATATPIRRARLTSRSALGRLVGTLGPEGRTVRGMIKVPDYLHYIRRYGIDDIRELTVLNESEMTVMAEVADKYMSTQAQARRVANLSATLPSAALFAPISRAAIFGAAA